MSGIIDIPVTVSCQIEGCKGTVEFRPMKRGSQSVKCTKGHRYTMTRSN